MIDWEAVSVLTGLWLMVAGFGAIIYMDMKRYRGRPTYTQSFARTILWPVILPLLVVKFVANVVVEIPEAIKELWGGSDGLR